MLTPEQEWQYCLGGNQDMTPTGRRVKLPRFIAHMYGSDPFDGLSHMAFVRTQTEPTKLNFDLRKIEARVALYLCKKQGTVHGTYIGPIERLHGHGALLRYVPDTGKMLAQFDDIKEFGAIPAYYSLAHGWHEFDRDDFGGIQ